MQVCSSCSSAGMKTCSSKPRQQTCSMRETKVVFIRCFLLEWWIPWWKRCAYSTLRLRHLLNFTRRHQFDTSSKPTALVCTEPAAFSIIESVTSPEFVVTFRLYSQFALAHEVDQKTIGPRFASLCEVRNIYYSPTGHRQCAAHRLGVPHPLHRLRYRVRCQEIHR